MMKEQIKNKFIILWSTVGFVILASFIVGEKNLWIQRVCLALIFICNGVDKQLSLNKVIKSNKSTENELNN